VKCQPFHPVRLRLRVEKNRQYVVERLKHLSNSFRARARRHPRRTSNFVNIFPQIARLIGTAPRSTCERFRARERVRCEDATTTKTTKTLRSASLDRTRAPGAPATDATGELCGGGWRRKRGMLPCWIANRERDERDQNTCRIWRAGAGPWIRSVKLPMRYV